MKWSYKIEEEPGGFDCTALLVWLESFGKCGWELCAITDKGTLYIFKRPM